MTSRLGKLQLVAKAHRSARLDAVSERTATSRIWVWISGSSAWDATPAATKATQIRGSTLAGMRRNLQAEPDAARIRAWALYDAFLADAVVPPAGAGGS